MSAIDELKFLEYVHRDVAVAENMEILFRGATVGGLEFLPLYQDCIENSDTPVGSWKTFRRAQRAVTLARYFEATLPLGGLRVECGVFRGFSSLMLARVARAHDPDFTGAGFHVVDSFEGLSPPSDPDAIAVREYDSGRSEPIYSHQGGHFATPVDHVRGVLADYPDIGIHKGWIPDAFAALPDAQWSFVHIDVDLYQPTKDCLDYFFPRLTAGGVIVNDDFASPLFPGGGRAWHEFLDARGLSYVVLDTGQAVYMK